MRNVDGAEKMADALRLVHHIEVMQMRTVGAAAENAAKHIDHDVSEKEITEYAKLFAEQGGELESIVEGEWEDEDAIFNELFAKREIEI